MIGDHVKELFGGMEGDEEMVVVKLDSYHLYFEIVG